MGNALFTSSPIQGDDDAIVCLGIQPDVGSAVKL